MRVRERKRKRESCIVHITGIMEIITLKYEIWVRDSNQYRFLVNIATIVVPDLVVAIFRSLLIFKPNFSQTKLGKDASSTKFTSKSPPRNNGM